MNAFFLHGVLFVRAASRISSVLITKTTVTFSFFFQICCSSVNYGCKVSSVLVSGYFGDCCKC